MQINLILVGKTTSLNIKAEMDQYMKRLSRYVSFSVHVISSTKKITDPEKQKSIESNAINKQIKKEDYVILLDERGQSFSSVDFAAYIEKLQMQSRKKVVFIIGGAFGDGTEIFQRADSIVALSKMTFSHQMVRLFFVEQLYRAYTIINQESYHHE